MSDWTGIGTRIETPSEESTSCRSLEYLSYDRILQEFPDELENASVESVLSRLDDLSDALETQLGHGFGRAVRLWSETAEISLEIDDDGVTLGAQEFDFDTYTTVSSLRDAIEAAIDGMWFQLLPMTPFDQPSSSLRSTGPCVVGIGYENRIHLEMTDLYIKTTGPDKSHLFLPFDIRSVSQIAENGVLLESTAYFIEQSWLIKSRCSGCPSGVWSDRYPGNVQVLFKPVYWGSIPRPISSHLLTLYADQIGATPMESEKFIDYSYTRGRSSNNAADASMLMAGTIRKYGKKVIIPW